MVSAIDASASQIDDDIRSIELCVPIAMGYAIPLDCTPGCSRRSATDHDDLVSGLMKRTRQDGSDLSSATWDNNLHKRPPSLYGF